MTSVMIVMMTMITIMATPNTPSLKRRERGASSILVPTKYWDCPLAGLTRASLDLRAWLDSVRFPGVDMAVVYYISLCHHLGITGRVT